MWLVSSVTTLNWWPGLARCPLTSGWVVCYQPWQEDGTRPTVTSESTVSPLKCFTIVSPFPSGNNLVSKIWGVGKGKKTIFLAITLFHKYLLWDLLYIFPRRLTQACVRDGMQIWRKQWPAEKKQLFFCCLGRENIKSSVTVPLVVTTSMIIKCLLLMP